MIRYRTENFAGSGERDAVNVMWYETFGLGNTDIFDTLSKSILMDHPLCEDFDTFTRELDAQGFVDDYTEDDGKAIMQRVLETVNHATGLHVRYALWLADKEVVQGFYQGTEADIESYTVGPLILSELGHDGTLYGYEQMPCPQKFPDESILK